MQVTGIVLGISLKDDLESDLRHSDYLVRGDPTLAHNDGSPHEILAGMGRLLNAGGRVLREADASPPADFADICRS